MNDDEKKGIRMFCWKDGAERPFVMDFHPHAPISNPRFSSFIFQMTGCDQIQFVPLKQCEVDLRKHATREELQKVAARRDWYRKHIFMEE
jgi:hypothetical protein